MSRILVTGASGFIGSALVSALAAEGSPKGLAVRAAYRSLPARTPTGAESVAVGSLSSDTDWRAALEGVTQVVHLAGPAHKRADADLYRREIADATDALAAQAEAAGAKRFVFMSSVKAAAERGVGLTEADMPAPESGYGEAKLEAEGRVLERASLAPVVLRPPLVHAANAKANFAALLRLAASPLPLPLGGIDNARSLIALDSLIAAIRAILSTPAGPSGVFFVADPPACSTTEIVTALRAGMGRGAGLVGPGALRALLPRTLTESLAIDDSAFRLAYAAPAPDSREALRRTGAAWVTGR